MNHETNADSTSNCHHPHRPTARTTLLSEASEAIYHLALLYEVIKSHLALLLQDRIGTLNNPPTLLSRRPGVGLAARPGGLMDKSCRG